MKTVIELSGEELERELQVMAVPMLVHFYRACCGSSEILAAALVALAGQLKDEMRLTRVNLDECPELAKRYGIAQVPALLLFETAQPIAWIDASMSPRQMAAQLQGLLADYAPDPRIAVGG